MFKSVLKNHIADSYLDGDSSLLDDDTELLALNIIDSAALFDLVAFIQQETHKQIQMQDINPINFASINTIDALLQTTAEET
ncbi:MAG: hypothetical protein OXE99_13360 [Cellvibrionales bacterium]|nr:hypothetical protein [Cellvibrionales bacterium]